MLESRGEAHTVIPGVHGSGCLPAALLGWQDSFVPNSYRAQGTWVSPCHWAAFASPKMSQMESQSGRQEWKQPGPDQDIVPGGWSLGPLWRTSKAGAYGLQREVPKNEKLQSRMKPHHRLSLREKLSLV